MATFVVNSTGTEGDSFLNDGICDTAHNPLTDPPTPKSNICTLRAAAEQASSSPGADRIEFDIPVGPGVVPVIDTDVGIVGTVEIDGTTQESGRVSVRSVALFGTGGSLIRGLVVREGGIHVDSNNNTIVGNFVGTDVEGATAIESQGIRITGNGNRVGGTSEAERNVFMSITVDGNQNRIEGNHIGVADSGESALGSGVISIDHGASNVIGGETAAHGNIIVGTIRVVGVSNSSDRTPSQTLIQNNLIGTNRAGNKALPFPGPGIVLSETEDSAIIGNTISSAVGPPAFVGAASGIVLSSRVHRTVIEGNRIGTNLAGTVTDPDGTPGTGDEFGNRDGGIIIDGAGQSATGNRVGGPSPAQANVIAGSDVGVRITNRADGNFVEGNFIGTDITGSTALPNSTGVEILFAGSNVIGGSRGNVVSGNTGTGIVVAGVSAVDNLVAGNIIGLNAAATAPLANDVGILINDAPRNCIGGEVPSEPLPEVICAAATGSLIGNVISGNARYGVQIANANARENVVRSNRIGTDAAGMVSDPDGIAGNADDLGNGWDGVAIQAGADENTIGGSRPSHRNVISGNKGDGVLVIGVSGDPSENNTVAGNYIGVDASGDAALGNGFRGVHIDGHATGNTVGGDVANERNIISGNGADGIILFSTTAAQNSVFRNYIGTDATGTKAVPNRANGVYILGAPQTSVGSIVDSSSLGNTISGNIGAGVRIEDASATGNVLVANRIGTDAQGQTGVPNGAGGIHIVNAPRNVIGGQFAGNPLAPTFPGNTVSGNLAAGIRIEGGTADQNYVGANLVGTDFSGTARVANRDHGIHIVGAPNTRIGQSLDGEPPLSGNTISGNLDGVRIEGTGATGTILGGNRIGTRFDGQPSNPPATLGNLLNGVHVSDAVDTLIGGVAFDGVGGAAQLQSNVIAGNLHGVRIAGDDAKFNTVQRNAIFSNQRNAIRLGTIGAVPNDALDADTGPNTLINRPVVTGLTEDGNVAVQYDGAPNQSFTIDVYRSRADGGDDDGEGEQWLQSVEITTDADGHADVLVPILFDSAMPFLTATATDVAGNTSEFSGPLRMPDLTIDSFSFFPQDVTLSNGRFVLPYAITVRNVGTAIAEDAVVRITGNGQPLALSGSQLTLAPGEHFTIRDEWDVTVLLQNGIKGVADVELAAIVDPSDNIAELPVATNERSAATHLDGRPVIARVDKALAEGVFLRDVALPNKIDVYVDWNGDLDGVSVTPNLGPRVLVQINGIEQPPVGDTSLAETVPTSFAFDMGGDLEAGVNLVRIVAELRFHGFESDGKRIQYDQAATVPWIGPALWTAATEGGPFDQVAVYSAGILFPDFATQGAFGIPVDRVGFAGGTLGSEFPSSAIRARVRSDGATELEGQLKMDAQLGSDKTGGAEAAISAQLAGGFQFHPDLTLEKLTGTLAGELAVTTPKIPFPPPASFLQAQGKLGLGVSAEIPLVEENNQLQWPSDLVLGLEPSLEAIVSVGAGPASVEAGAGGSIRGEFSLAGNPCVPLGGEVNVFLRVKANFLVFEAEKTFSFPFALPACGGAGEGEIVVGSGSVVSSEMRLAQRYLPVIYGPVEGESTGSGLPTIPYAFAKPALARYSDGTMMLVFVGEDSAKPTGQQLEILATHFDGTQWSTPMQLTDDTLLDDAPSIAYDNQGNAVAVWTRLKKPLADAANTDPHSILGDFEVVSSVYDAATGVWSSPAAITDDSVMDYAPTVASGPNGTVMAAWLRDPQNDTPVFPDDSSPLSAQYFASRWDGQSWTAPELVADAVMTNEAPSLSVGNGQAVLVWSGDADGDLATSDDRDILGVTWDGDEWSDVTAVSAPADGIADITPVASRDTSGHARILWSRTGVAVSEQEADLTDQLAWVDHSATGFSSPQVGFDVDNISGLAATVAADGNVIAVWQGQSAVGPDLFYSRLDPLGGVWAEPIQVTETPALEWEANPYVDDDGQLQVVYLERSIGSAPFGGSGSGEGEDGVSAPVFVSSSVNSSQVPLGVDLELPDLRIVGDPIPGETITVEALVRNGGDTVSAATTVVLSEGGGGSELSAPVGALRPGETQSVSILWAVQPSATPLQLQATVDPHDEIAESNEDNNSASIVTRLPDLVVGSVRAATQGDTIAMTATVQNVGDTPSAATDLRVMLENRTDGPTLAIVAVPPLNAGGSAEIAFSLNDIHTILVRPQTAFVVVDGANSVIEASEDNNADVVFLNPFESWQNPFDALDVNNDGLVTPRDALLQINDLNERGARILPVIPTPPMFFDSSGDHLLSPRDVLLVISFLGSGSEGEGDTVESGSREIPLDEIQADAFHEETNWTSHL